MNADAAPRARGLSVSGFFVTSGLLYAGVILIAALTLNPYFAQTWDVSTFVHAARRLLDGNPWDLYAQSRAAQTWPYAYPPLHALAVAITLSVGDLLRAPPDYVWARAPALLADIGVALTLYALVRRKSNDEALARGTVLLWLFNPVTFYDTAVQGHFESEWLLCVLLAYAWFEEGRGIALPALALALAVLFKQIAILFALPLWVFLAKAEGRRMKDEALHNSRDLRPSSFIPHPSSLRFAQGRLFILHLFLFASLVGAVCLPFLLYSDDFLYMNFTYVENVPVQTQSWIVGLLGLTRASPQAFTSDFFLLRYQTIVTLLAAAALAFCAARRGWSLYLTATLIALAFFLTSKKVMGYYYVMLFPFLFVEVLPKRRFDLALLAIVATTWISLSPYYASWGNPAHWWMYALLGTAHSLFFVWLFVAVTDAGRRTTTSRRQKAEGRRQNSFLHPSSFRLLPSEVVGVGQRSAVFVTLGLFAGAALAAFLQPFAPKTPSPIRAPIIAPGMEWNVLAAFAALLGLLLLALTLIARGTRNWEGAIPRAAWGVALIFAPLFFSVYYLTKESTAVFELVFKLLGV